jgi:hypothetical protein
MCASNEENIINLKKDETNENEKDNTNEEEETERVGS